MSKLNLSIPMSQIIAHDAPLLSPVSMNGDSQWDHPLFSPTTETFAYGYYNLPTPPHSDTAADSPIPPTKMLKMRMSPDAAAESEQLCVPTHQLFDSFPEALRPPTPPTRASSLLFESTAHPQSIAPAYASCAAFLSRQRKREEFECMEIRVAELEQENARLLALTQNGSATIPQPAVPEKLLSEVEILKAQLAAAAERERTLSAQLASTNTATRDSPAVKQEALEPQFLLSSPPRSTSVPSAHKSGASLGLMVLLCALPTLLSMRMQSAAPTSFSIPNPYPASSSSSSSFDYSSFLPGEYDWSKYTGSSLMDLDEDSHNRAPTTRKLEFTGTDAALGGLGDLDISFDTSPSDDGKIRVRIHPSSSANSRSGSPDGMHSDSHSFSSTSPSSSSSLSMWNSDSSALSRTSSFSSTGSDPFLGVTTSSANDFIGMPFAADGSMCMYGAMGDLSAYEDAGSPFGGSEYSVPDSTSMSGKRRVRIALKSMPQAGGEGGEWEVQIC
ncbi:unnamed protein product [Cyclocybe aegerita]|uniref:Uncharacterized protein n=1 Tax=Cyclocybe aegerita TaxID=1973307 RepID=A0A8S0VTK2_CYCAE|nr:unnamed protein product [Cyclocybe aegerita]